MASKTSAQTEAAIILEGVARAIEAFPADELDSAQRPERDRQIAKLRSVAEAVWPAQGGAEFEAGAAIGASEYRNAVLLAMLPTDTVYEMIAR